MLVGIRFPKFGNEMTEMVLITAAIVYFCMSKLSLLILHVQVDLACFFLPSFSHLSLQHVCIYVVLASPFSLSPCVISKLPECVSFSVSHNSLCHTDTHTHTYAYMYTLIIKHIAFVT